MFTKGQRRVNGKQDGLTPYFAILSKYPVVLPELPDPFGSRAAFAYSIVLTFDSGEHGCVYLVVCLVLKHHRCDEEREG